MSLYAPIVATAVPATTRKVFDLKKEVRFDRNGEASFDCCGASIERALPSNVGCETKIAD